MKATVNGKVVIITLSRKNLRDLVAQAIEGYDTVALQKRTPDFVVYLSVEDNDTHYGDSPAGPGSGLAT